MKITPRLLSIPPYISTTWDHVSSLHVQNQRLIVSLEEGSKIEIPDLSEQEIDSIFQAHAEFNTATPKMTGLDPSMTFSLPLKGEGLIESFGSGMQHNPEQANLPPIPSHVLEKIGIILHSLGFEDTSVLDKPQSDCQCMYCQLARFLQPKEEEVQESDLRFRDWEVSQTKERLYHVVNPLDKNEYYDVFLGDPIGCTCGSKHCEHIKAVLNT